MEAIVIESNGTALVFASPHADVSAYEGQRFTTIHYTDTLEDILRSLEQWHRAWYWGCRRVVRLPRITSGEPLYAIDLPSYDALLAIESEAFYKANGVPLPRWGTEIEGAFDLDAFKNHATGWWRYKYDASLSIYVEDREAVEVVPKSPFNGITDALMAFSSLPRPRVNHTCGLHIHIEFTNEVKRRILRDIARWKRNPNHMPLPFRLRDRMVKMLPPRYVQRSFNRGNNRWAAFHTEDTYARDVEAISRNSAPPSRYVEINLCAVWSHGTVEWRLPAPTRYAETAIALRNMFLRELGFKLPAPKIQII